MFRWDWVVYMTVLILCAIAVAIFEDTILRFGITWSVAYVVGRWDESSGAKFRKGG